MKIISFIEKEQSDVLKKTHRHCGFWKEAPPRLPPKPIPEDSFKACAEPSRSEPAHDYGFFDRVCI